jgi:hypothetical protein
MRHGPKLRYWPRSNLQTCFSPPSSSRTVPPRAVWQRPPAKSRGFAFAAALQHRRRVARRRQVHAPGFHAGQQEPAAAHGERFAEERTAGGNTGNVERCGGRLDHDYLNGVEECSGIY